MWGHPPSAVRGAKLRRRGKDFARIERTPLPLTLILLVWSGHSCPLPLTSTQIPPELGGLEQCRPDPTPNKPLSWTECGEGENRIVRAASPSSGLLCGSHFRPPSPLCRSNPPAGTGGHCSFLGHCDGVRRFALGLHFRPSRSLGSCDSGSSSGRHPTPRCSPFPVCRSES
jgi:hypothetical protein